MRTIWMKRAVLRIGRWGQRLPGSLWFAWPRPIPVDLATVTKGPMEVTVDDEAKTRVRHVYTVSAPIAGKVLRISHPDGEQETSRHVGDQVTADETIVAVMQPTAPSFLDVRSHEELQAAVAAAEAAVKLGGSRSAPDRGGARVLAQTNCSAPIACAYRDDLRQGPGQGQDSTSRPMKPRWRARRPSSMCGAASRRCAAARLIDPGRAFRSDRIQAAASRFAHRSPAVSSRSFRRAKRWSRQARR